MLAMFNLYSPIAMNGVVYRGDVRMIERRQQLRFAPETGDPLRVPSKRPMQAFHGDTPIQFGVPRAVPLPHAACTNHAGNFIRTQPCPDRESGGVGSWPIGAQAGFEKTGGMGVQGWARF